MDQQENGIFRTWLLRTATGLLIAALAMPGCFDVVEGGASDDQEEIGRQDRGRDTGDFFSNEEWDEETESFSWEYTYFYKEVILSPDGKFLLAMVGVPGPDLGWAAPDRVLVVQPLPSGKPRVFSDVTAVDRINFSPDGRDAWILEEDAHRVRRLDLTSFQVSGFIDLGARFRVLDVTPDGRHLVLSNLPLGDNEEAGYDGDQACWDSIFQVNRCDLALVDIQTGTVLHKAFPKRLRDLDYHRPTRRLLVTWGSYNWTADRNETTVAFVDPVSGGTEDIILFPNCADELKIVPGDDLALLSPTHCLKKSVQVSQDPISVIDLETRTFVKNLPGFGPVAINPDGTRAVGFTRREVMEDEWSYFDQDTPVGLIAVDLDTLAWRVMDYGSKMPVYTISPDGEYLFIHEEGSSPADDANDEGWDYNGDKFHDFARIRLQDFSRKVIQEVGLGLERYSWSPDGDRLYGLCDGAAFSIDVATGALDNISWTGHDLMSLRPQGDLLILAPGDAPDYLLLDTKTFAPVVTHALSL